MAAAEDITQRKPNPWFVRVTSTPRSARIRWRDYAAKELKYKRMALIGDDFAYGHEQNAGFQRVFEDKGGKVVQKLWPPLNAPDYGTYIAQLKHDIDGIFMSFAGLERVQVLQGIQRVWRRQVRSLGGMTAVDEAVLQQMGDDAVGADLGQLLLGAAGQSAEQEVRRRHAAATTRSSRAIYARRHLRGGRVLEAALTGDRRQDRGQGTRS